MTAIDEFFTQYYLHRPVNATFSGVHGRDHRLPDWSLGGLEALDDAMTSLGSELAADYPAPVSAAAFTRNPDLLDAELARSFLEIQRAENETLHGPRGNPALWTGEAIFSIVALMIREFAPPEERIELASRRLRELSGFLRGSRVRAGLALRADAVTVSAAPAGLADAPAATFDPRTPIPRAWIEKALRDCEGARILLANGFRRWLATAALPTEQFIRLQRASAKGWGHLRAFAAALRSQPEAPETAMACGTDLFDLLLARGHYCQRSRADLLAEARGRFADARAELDRLAAAVAGSLDNAQAQLAADHPAPDRYFATFESTWQDCYACASEANVIGWPDWPIRYVPYPAWTADAAPHLYYLFYRSPAPFDPYTVYDYVVPPLPTDVANQESHLRVWNNSAIKLNHVVHHGAIGHHVQNWYAYNQQRSRVGQVAAVDCASRIGMFCGGTMAEGWACYATDLMEELGFLTPLERVSQQHTRVRMLARAIVDIELHQGTMSFAEAIAFYAERVGMSADAARAETVKNSMFPCTAIMYWLGTQGIHDLRSEMKRREGPRFSLRRFHDELLGYGSIPVPLVTRMLTEVARQGQ